MPLRLRLTPLGSTILARLDELGWSQRELGERLGHTGPGLVAHVINGRRPLPLPTLSLWVRALDLDDVEAEAFRREVLLSHTPPELVTELRRLWKLEASLRRRR